MDISYIAGSFIPSLTANSLHVMKMCQAFTQEGHTVVLYANAAAEARMASPIWDHYGIRDKFNIELFSPKAALRQYDFAAWAVWQSRRRKAELVYTRHLAAAAFSSRHGLPTSYEAHGIPGGTLGRFLFKQHLTGKGFRSLVVISAALQKLLVAAYGALFAQRKIVVAHDAVDLERFATLPSPQEARRGHDVPPAFTVGYSGSLYVGRGIELILNLADCLPHVAFRIFGGDELSVDSLRRSIAERGLSNVHLHGFIKNSELPSYLAMCDVLTMPYQRVVYTSSGQQDTSAFMSPLKLFEYMAMSRPIVSSNLPVLHEVLDDTRAIFCPPDDLHAWSSAIESLRQNPEAASALAAAARREVEHYTWRRRVAHCLEA